MRATLGDKDRIDAVNVTPLNLFQKFYVGGNTWRHTTGWRYDGKRAIKVSLARKFFTARKAVVLSDGFHLEWHLEVAFRKKGFLGVWYNFRNNSDTFITITYLSDFGFPTSQKQTMKLIASGYMSSHDMQTPAYVIKHIIHTQDSWNNVYDYYTGLKMYPNCVYELPGYSVDISTYIGGFPHQRIYFYAPKLWSYTTFITDKLK